jgi:hypothetical protein
MASGFGGTTNEKEDSGIKRPAIGINALVSRSPGAKNSTVVVYANPLGTQRKTKELCKSGWISFPKPRALKGNYLLIIKIKK